jgi:hypothetical protein
MILIPLRGKVVCPVSLYFDLLGQNTKNRNKKDLSDPFLFRKEKGFAFFLSFCRVTSNGHTTKGKAKRRKEEIKEFIPLFLHSFLNKKQSSRLLFFFKT